MNKVINYIKWAIHRVYGGPWYKKIVVWFFTLLMLLILFLLAVDNDLFGLFGASPSMRQVRNPRYNEASIIYSADSVMLGRYFNENRTTVDYEDISPILTRTLIDTEDERFYSHWGVDYTALFSAAKDAATGHARGASTITQQLAKNLFKMRSNYSTGRLGRIPGLSILIQKSKEWLAATKLEASFTKEDIITLYLNTVDFGNNSYGIETACRQYFGVKPNQLTYEQAAVLVGVLKATNTYNPRVNPQNALARRNTVLRLVYEKKHMLIDGKPATQAQFDSICALPIELVPEKVESVYDGEAPYFRVALDAYIQDLCNKGLIKGYGLEHPIDLYNDGLTIYTTLDTRMQKMAEDAVMKHMEYVQQRFREHWGNANPWQDDQHREVPHFLEDIAKKTDHYKQLKKQYGDQQDSIDFYLNQPHHMTLFSYNGPWETDMSTMDSIRYMVSFMHAGFVVMEPQTRRIKAWVGDIDFKSWKYDKVTSRNQPGSTFKLFVYTEAMNQGLSPRDRRLDAYKQYDLGGGMTWAPHNADGGFTGMDMTLKQAFAQSVNSVAVRLGFELGINNIAATAHSMGIQSPLEEVPSLALGSSDVCLLDMVNSYSTIVNDGIYNMPIMVTKILDRDGNVIYQPQLENKQAIPYRSAFLMQEMLKGGLTVSGGTSWAMHRYAPDALRTTEFGGKTGTSNSHADAWYMGVSPKLVGGVWVGGEYRCIHFRTGEMGQGARTALPIWGYFVNTLLTDDRFEQYRGKFPEPKEEIVESQYTIPDYAWTEENDSTNEITESIEMEEGVDFPVMTGNSNGESPEVPSNPTDEYNGLPVTPEHTNPDNNNEAN